MRRLRTATSSWWIFSATSSRVDTPLTVIRPPSVSIRAIVPWAVDRLRSSSVAARKRAGELTTRG
jgi:hypothetical protein